MLSNNQDAPRTAYPFLPIPFLEQLGVQRESVAGGKARISLELQPQFRNLYDGFHGGVMASLADSLCGYGCFSSLPPGATGFTTLARLWMTRPE